LNVVLLKYKLDRFKGKSMKLNNIFYMRTPKRPKPGGSMDDKFQKALDYVEWKIPRSISEITIAQFAQLLKSEYRNGHPQMSIVINQLRSKNNRNIDVPVSIGINLGKVFSANCRDGSVQAEKAFRPLWESWDYATSEHLRITDPEGYENVKVVLKTDPWDR
jgi:hypothetical protein